MKGWVRQKIIKKNKLLMWDLVSVVVAQIKVV